MRLCLGSSTNTNTTLLGTAPAAVAIHRVGVEACKEESNTRRTGLPRDVSVVEVRHVAHRDAPRPDVAHVALRVVGLLTHTQERKKAT